MPRFDPHPARRAAVVTGASSGIGQATALALAANGHPVVLGARRTERCEATAREIREAGGEAIAVPLDLLDPDSVKAFAATAEAELGPIEVLVSNAGDVQPITVVGADPDEFVRQLSVNLTGAQRLVHHLVPGMVERRRGDVVFVTSEVAVRPRTHMAGYVASKAGLEGLADAMRMELEGTGVRVGVVRPGPSSTEQGTTWDEATVNEVVASWNHWGLLRHSGAMRPKDVAAAIVAIVSVPRGTQFALLEVQPEAPVQGPPVEHPEGER
ncbi:MAG TPA: SDR family oxidoreductase [Microthrixaceae bacterium]|nr:SDR family oxidoreductase [Microthrixaceae bacterium]